MSEKTQVTTSSDETSLSRAVGQSADRKIKARRNSAQAVWFGLGMMGLVGWSVVIPTLLGAALGIWLDKNHPESFSWTLTLLLIGLFTGCLNAWHWVSKEDQAMREEQRDE
jgi:ATP synthase protein I